MDPHDLPQSTLILQTNPWHVRIHARGQRLEGESIMLVTYKVVSIEGHIEVTLPVWEAVEELARLRASCKWVYIDGQHWTGKPDASIETMLLDAEDITVTNQLCGG